MKHRALLPAILLGLSACLGDTVLARARDGSSGDSSALEGGTADLLIEGDCVGTSHPESQEQRSWEVRWSLRISRNRAPINARVQLRSATGVETLEPDGDRYKLTQRMFSPPYTLVIETMGNPVFTAELPAITPHTITAPREDEVLRAGTPLVVRWMPTNAMLATIETNTFPATPVADTGSFTIPGETFRVEPGQLREDRVRVSRSQLLSIAGSPGSFVRFEFRNEASFQLDAR